MKELTFATKTPITEVASSGAEEPGLTSYLAIMRIYSTIEGAVVVFDTLEFSLNEYFVELNRAKFKFLNKARFKFLN